MVRPGPPELARRLAERIDRLAPDLLPAGHREGCEWRCGSVAGEAGASLGVRLTGAKAGVWSDFNTGQRGDALDLVCAVLGLDVSRALGWSGHWLGIDGGDPALPVRPGVTAPSTRSPSNPDRSCRAWQAARPIVGTFADTYLTARSLPFDDPKGRVLRFAECHARRSARGELQHLPAMLALLSDVRTGEACGIINVYLRPDGSDRLRDPKGKTTWGRAGNAAVMLSAFDEPTYSLAISEGAETAIALLMADLAPVWALGGAGNLVAFPILGGIECLTIAAGADEPGQKAAAIAAQRWRDAGREVVIIAPPTGDWADGRG